MNKSIHAVLFDAFGTTVDWYTGLSAAFAEIGNERGIALPSGELAVEWRQGYMEKTKEISTGNRPWTDLELLLREVLDVVLERHGLGDWSTEDRLRLLLGWRRLPAWPDAALGLSRIKSRFIIAPLSNGHFAQLADLGKLSGLPWDAVLPAELFHQFKTHPDVYLGACNLLRSTPDRVMLVACHQADLDAARKAGMPTAFVHRPLEFGPPPRERDSQADADIMASDFLELASKLGT